MGNKYVYVLFDDNEGDIGTFTSLNRAVRAAIDNGWCERYYDDDITTPQQVFDSRLMAVEKIPLNEIFY